MNNVVEHKQDLHPVSLTTFYGMIALLRTRHWVKNGFVLIGAIFGNVWAQPKS